MTAAPNYRKLAIAQGVARPFDILVRMHPENRRLVAKLLGCELHRCIDPRAQAWVIINKNLWGLQARTHTIPEQLTPFSRNNNWWEIVTRVARRVGVRYYPGVGEGEVERLVFEQFAESFVETKSDPDAKAIDSLVGSHPVVQQAMASLRLSPTASRSVLSGLALATLRADVTVRDGCQKVGEWFMSGLRWSWAISVNSALKLLQHRTTDLYTSWYAAGRGNSSKVALAVSMIYFQDLVDRTVEEFEGC